MLYLNLPMKRLIIFFVFIISILGLVFFSTNHTSIVFASRNTTFTALDPTPIPLLFAATATVDPASIGDTSGVIAIGMIVVFIILAGVIWGTLELRQESSRNKQPKE